MSWSNAARSRSDPALAIETVKVEGRTGKQLQVTAMPARHSPAGFEQFSRDVTGFALGIPGDGVYVTGDTVGTTELQRFSAVFRRCW